jgi:HPt (histidine-containing phosphotransfer) domain-containing protein
LTNLNIEGVNVKKGLARLGGRVKSYQKILGVFCKDSRQKLAELEDCFVNENVALYTTHVHGLKSALGNIGAEKLAKDAERLELEGDWNYVLANHKDFAEKFYTLIADIDLVLADAAAPEDGKAIDRQKLAQTLRQLRQSLDIMDFGGMKAAADILMEYEEAPEIGGKIKALLHNRLAGEYDAAITRIDALLKEIW